jgi:hypothetical protein
MSRAGDDRPVLRLRPADAAEAYHHAPSGGVDDPPVVALHAALVRTARVPERRVGPRPAVGMEQTVERGADQHPKG